ncbi:MAG: CAP domain-containing protein [Myxococcales bacterium]|nr:CAP domain-containing protein [Myxococcales bacterium]MCB1009618.1 CAP domain-containing protein [Acidobacteriota bacterium]MCB9736957.1 CAP domain-containing protein [Deltaproteobacteria bacterium]
MRRLILTLLLATAWTTSACDTKIVGTDNALIDLTPGPQTGTVSSSTTPNKADGTTTDPAVTDPTGDAGSAADALAYLEDVRSDLGLPALTQSPLLTSASQAHANYLVTNHAYHDAHGLSPHVEVPELQGFTGESGAKRSAAAGYTWQHAGEVIGYHGTPEGTMVAWMESLYHRLPLIRREVKEIGLGVAGDLAYHAHVVEVGAEPGAYVNSGKLLAYPADGAVDVPTEWSGREVPEPTPPPAGWPSGPVLTVTADRGTVTVVSSSVRVAASGAELPHTLLTSANDSHLQARDVALIPHAPLAPATAYVATISGLRDGATYTFSWTFTTRAAGCAVDADDCGPGRACYPLNGTLTCLYKGSATLGEACQYVDDCGGGLTCLGGQCRELCASGACDASCAGESKVPSSVSGVQVCLGPACTASSCGAGEGCYWLSGLACSQAGTVPRGGSCTYADDCQAGSTCLSAGGAPATCQALCDGAGMPACDNVCASTAFTLDAKSQLKACP